MTGIVSVVIRRAALLSLASSLPLLAACGGDEDTSSPTPTSQGSAPAGRSASPAPQDSTLVEQGTQAAFAGLRVGVISVSPGPASATGGSALLSLSIQSQGTPAPARTVTLGVGETITVETGTLRLLEAIKGAGGGRDAVRLQFEPRK